MHLKLLLFRSGGVVNLSSIMSPLINLLFGDNDVAGDTVVVLTRRGGAPKRTIRFGLCEVSSGEKDHILKDPLL